MTTVQMDVGGRRVIVSRPEGSEPGRLSVDMLAALAAAREAEAGACLLRPAPLVNDALFALTTDEVPIVEPDVAGGWARARWQAADAAAAARQRAREAAAAFWLEWYRELRRHAGDERLPLDLRGRLRHAAHRSFERAREAPPAVFPRLLLRQRVRMRLPDERRVEAEAAAAALGIVTDRPLVAVDLRGPEDPYVESFEHLVGQGFGVVMLGQSPLVDVWVLLTSAFLICDHAGAQHTAYLTATPTLTVNATDAFTHYPVRGDGLYLLKTVIDLDSGRVLPLAEYASEGYYRNLRNWGYRANTAREIRAAVDEMTAGVARGWEESPAQAAYRSFLVEAGAALAPRVRHVARWGPVAGFLGDGRLASVQAERV